MLMARMACLRGADGASRAEAKIPMMVLTPAALSGNTLHWSFIVPQTTELMMGAVAQQLKAQGVKTVAISLHRHLGDLVYKAIQSHAASAGFKVVTRQRYARSTPASPARSFACCRPIRTPSWSAAPAPARRCRTSR